MLFVALALLVVHSYVVFVPLYGCNRYRVARGTSQGRLQFDQSRGNYRVHKSLNGFESRLASCVLSLCICVSDHATRLSLHIVADSTYIEGSICGVCNHGSLECMEFA